MPNSNTLKTEKPPITHIVHWATGPVPCCAKHAKELVSLGEFMGSHVACTKPEDGVDYVCSNCENEQKG